MILPLMLFHQIQLMVCAFLAQRWAAQRTVTLETSSSRQTSFQDGEETHAKARLVPAARSGLANRPGTVLAAAIVFGVLFIRAIRSSIILTTSLPSKSRELFPSAHALADPLAIGGNKIELLHNGKMIFPAMLAAIKVARDSISSRPLS